MKNTLETQEKGCMQGMVDKTLNVAGKIPGGKTTVILSAFLFSLFAMNQKAISDTLKVVINDGKNKNEMVFNNANCQVDNKNHLVNCTVGENVNTKTNAKESGEQAEILKEYEKQYGEMEKTLDFYEISKKGMPSFEQVKKGLTKEVLEKASKLSQPTLLLVPPTTRAEKVKALDQHKISLQKYDTFTYDFKNDDLWNNGENEKSTKKWEVQIVEGVQDVKKDENITGTNYEMTKKLVEKYEKQGLDIVSGADVYLTLMMRSLQTGKPIDKDFFTVLNGKNLTKSSLVAYGRWYRVQVFLDYAYPSRSFFNLRLRGAVRVDVQN